MSNDIVKATGRVISNFGYQHLTTCLVFRDRLAQIEAENQSKEFGSFFELIRSYGSAGIMAAAASIEALINELYIDPQEKLRPTISDFENGLWGKGGIEWKPILGKYNHALKILGIKEIEETDPKYIAANAVIELRNALVHFKPIWDVKRKRQIDLESVLLGKFNFSPFPDSGADFVTMKAMSADCLRWAILSVGDFVEEFQKRAQLNQKKMSRFIEHSKK